MVHQRLRPYCKTIVSVAECTNDDREKENKQQRTNFINDINLFGIITLISPGKPNHIPHDATNSCISRLHKPFVLHNDASEQGLGAVLYQKQDGVMRVVDYGSRTFNKAERNYHLHSGKLEFLALKWAICEHFCIY